MAKVAAVQTISPRLFVSGAPIYHENWQAIAEQANWAALHPVQHFGMCVAHDNWKSGSTTLGGCNYVQLTSASYVTLFEFNIYSRAETNNFLVGAECNLGDPATGIKLRWTIGATAAFEMTTEFRDTDNDTEQTDTISNTASADGWQLVTVEGQRTLSTGNAYVNHLRMSDEIIAAASLPGPLNT